MAKASGFVVFACNDTPDSKLVPQVFHFDKLQNARCNAEDIIREGDYNVCVVMPCVYLITQEDNPGDPNIVTATPQILKVVPERGRRVKKGEKHMPDDDTTPDNYAKKHTHVLDEKGDVKNVYAKTQKKKTA